MRSVVHSILAIGLVLLGTSACNNGPRVPTESSMDECSNGRDDDNDGMTDCRDLACSVYAFCTAMDAGVDASVVDADSDGGPRPDAGTCDEPLDIVFSIDVSTSMAGELAAVSEGIGRIWTTATTLSSNAQFSLVVFVDDALAVNDCAPFATPEALVAELEVWRAFCASNQSPVSHLANQDCAENSVDAIVLAATTCTFRPGSTRILVHVTDDTFAERPAVLSGEWGGGVFVEHTYAEALEQLMIEQIRVGAFAFNGAGESCGAGISPDVGRGFHGPFDTRASLPMATGGRVWDLREVRAARLDMATAINEMLRAEYCSAF